MQNKNSDFKVACSFTKKEGKVSNCYVFLFCYVLVALFFIAHIYNMTYQVALHTLEEIEDVKMYQDFSIPDNILKAFITTHPLHMLLKKQDRFNQKTFVHYQVFTICCIL